MFQFFVPILFSSIFPTSLFPFISYQISSLFFSCFLGSNIGNLYDLSKRYFGSCLCPQLFQVLQIFSIFFCCVGFYWLYEFEGLSSDHPSERKVNAYWPFRNNFSFPILVGCVICNSIYQLMIIGTTVFIRKDWSIQLSSGRKGNPKNLETVNLILYSIDMFSNATAPLILSFLMWKYSTLLGIYIVGIWVVLMYFPEAILLFLTFFTSPTLRSSARTVNVLEENKASVESKVESASDQKSASKNQEYLLSSSNIFKCLCCGGFSTNPIFVLFIGLRDYLSQDVLFSSISFVILFFTVLSPDNILLAYLKFCSVDDRIIGSFKTVSAIMGYISVSLITPVIINRCGIRRSGYISLYFQVSLLVFGVAAYEIGFVFFGDITAIYVLMWSIAISRIGLWGFDFTQTQIMQRGVKLEKRGIVNSVETSLTNFATMLMFIVSLVAAQPQLFPIMVGCSIFCNSLSFFCFCCWGYSSKGLEVNSKDMNLRKRKEIEIKKPENSTS